MTKLPDCPGLEIYSQNSATLKCFRGVVGYHIRLTRGRSPVRTRTKTNSFLLLSTKRFQNSSIKLQFTIYAPFLRGVNLCGTQNTTLSMIICLSEIHARLHYEAQRGKNLPLCVIFTILVSFSRDNALFASKAKINLV